MGRITQYKSELVQNALSYVSGKIGQAITDLQQESDTRFKTSYISGKDASAKAHLGEAIKMLRWLYEKEFSLTAVTALTNAQVDAINENIRTLDDGM